MAAMAEDLRAALEQVLGGIVQLERRPSAYRTSFPLEQLELVLDNGSSMTIMFKDLSHDALAERAVAAKPSFLYDPLREIEAYRILRGTSLGVPECVTSVVEPDRGRFWLFLEKVSGVELYQVGELSTWMAAARWLARLHSRFSGARLPQSGALLRYDASFLRIWVERAAERYGGEVASVAAHYNDVISLLASQPRALLHGEFVASNVLVSRDDRRLRVAPVDWEMAGTGPGVLDLAALSSGSWGPKERLELACAYADELGTGALGRELLEAARLQVALQWLGWSPDWTPPAEHAHDWLGEALDAAEGLGIRGR
jgi:aminoglycoside phosphotransferase (APT) family kinase protein